MSSNHSGYQCKQCGGPSPVGVGYVDTTPGAAEASATLTACGCGYSRLEPGAAGYGPAAPLTPNAQRLAARGYAPPFTLAQSLAWVEQSAAFARQAAARYVPTARQHGSHTREAERFEAVAAQLQRLHDLDAADEG
jgi:hypothetical protein